MSHSTSRTFGEQFIIEHERAALERRLDALTRRRVRLRLNNNRRTFFSCRLERGLARVSLHQRFIRAPKSIVEAVARMIDKSDAGAAALCREWIERRDAELGDTPPPLPASLRRTRGRHHDLAALAEAVNRRYFGGRMNARITWGRQASGRGAARRRRRSIQFGCYDRTLDLIRIHPILDAPETPTYYLDYLIYHEMLHKALGASGAPEGVRRRVHHDEFKRREREHKSYARALAWEKAFFEALSSGRSMPPANAPKAPAARTKQQAPTTGKTPSAKPSFIAGLRKFIQLSLFDDF